MQKLYFLDGQQGPAHCTRGTFYDNNNYLSITVWFCVHLKKEIYFILFAGDMDDANYEDENDNTFVFISNGREGLKNYSAM